MLDCSTGSEGVEERSLDQGELAWTTRGEEKFVSLQDGDESCRLLG